MTNKYKVIRDCGYGKVWSRLATDLADALQKINDWKHEGRSDKFINGGNYFFQPIREFPNGIGGYSNEPIGERTLVL